MLSSQVKQSKFANFMFSQYLLSSFGIGIIGLLSYVLFQSGFAHYLFRQGLLIYIAINLPIIIITIIIRSRIQNINYVLNNSVSHLVQLLSLEMLLISVLTCPLGFYLRSHPDIFLNAFLTTVVCFFSISAFVLVSKKDLSFSEDENAKSNFISFMYALATMLMSLFAVEIILFFSGIDINAISLVINFVALLLNLGYIIYCTGLIKKSYSVYENEPIALSRIAIMGTGIFINSFIDMFRNILEIYMRLSDKKNR